MDEIAFIEATATYRKDTSEPVNDRVTVEDEETKTISYTHYPTLDDLDNTYTLAHLVDDLRTARDKPDTFIALKAPEPYANDQDWQLVHNTVDVTAFPVHEDVVMAMALEDAQYNGNTLGEQLLAYVSDDHHLFTQVAERLLKRYFLNTTAAHEGDHVSDHDRTIDTLRQITPEYDPEIEFIGDSVARALDTVDDDYNDRFDIDTTPYQPE